MTSQTSITLYRRSAAGGHSGQDPEAQKYLHMPSRSIGCFTEWKKLISKFLSSNVALFGSFVGQLVIPLAPPPNMDFNLVRTRCLPSSLSTRPTALTPR
jgi:hypothetical protein